MFVLWCCGHIDYIKHMKVCYCIFRFGSICAHYPYHVIHCAIRIIHAWYSPLGKGNSHFLCRLSYKTIWRYKISPPYVMARCLTQRIPFFNFLGFIFYSILILHKYIFVWQVFIVKPMVAYVAKLPVLTMGRVYLWHHRTRSRVVVWNRTLPIARGVRMAMEGLTVDLVNLLLQVNVEVGMGTGE